MKKGFTLVELLAVIVILAIVLAIAIPAISNVMASVSKKALGDSAKLILNSVGIKIAEDENYDVTTINATNIDDKLNIEKANYNSLNIEKISGNNFIVVEGKNKWADLKACGTRTKIVVVATSDTTTCQNLAQGIVNDPNTSVCNQFTASLNDVSLVVGETYTYMKPSALLTWTSSDNNVATVSDGIVTAVAAGNVIITATSSDNKTTLTSSVTIINSYVTSGLARNWPLSAATIDEASGVPLTNYGLTFVSDTISSKTVALGGAGYAAFPTTGLNIGYITVSMWVKQTATNQTFFSMGVDSVMQVIALQSLNTHFTVERGSGHFETSKFISDGEWHNVVATTNSTTNALMTYVDGVPITSFAATFNTSGGMTTGYLGSWLGGAGRASTYMSRLLIYTRPLSAEEVLHNYNVDKNSYRP